MNPSNALVVDDDVAVCRILHRMLSDEQYQVQISQSVADAIAAIEQKLFDIYIVDYKLKDGTGLDVAERIRSKGSEAPIILISGYDPSAVALRAEKLHIFDIIEKPFSRALIVNAVKKAIGFTPTPEPPNEESLSAGSVETATPSSQDLPAKEKHFPKAAIIGTILFLLLLSCFVIYFFTHGI
jgi:two-component system, NtrC family, response regulator HydG